MAFASILARKSGILRAHTVEGGEKPGLQDEVLIGVQEPLDEDGYAPQKSPQDNAG